MRLHINRNCEDSFCKTSLVTSKLLICVVIVGLLRDKTYWKKHKENWQNGKLQLKCRIKWNFLMVLSIWILSLQSWEYYFSTWTGMNLLYWWIERLILRSELLYCAIMNECQECAYWINLSLCETSVSDYKVWNKNMHLCRSKLWRW